MRGEMMRAGFIRNRRRELNMSMETLAGKLGVSRQTIAHIEKSDDWRVKILDALQLTIVRNEDALKTLGDYSTEEITIELAKRIAKGVEEC